MNDFSFIGDPLHFLGWIGQGFRLWFTPKVERGDADHIRITDFFVGAGVLVLVVLIGMSVAAIAI